jgi:hypothetical protein
MEAVAETLEYAPRQRGATVERTDRPWLRIGLETLVGLALIALTGWAVWYQDGDLWPIVYTTWCVVLVEAARHGPLPGVILAMLVCAGEGLVLVVQPVDESAFAYGGLLLPSLAGVALTVAVGEFAQAQRQRNAQALAHVRELTATLHAERAHLAGTADTIASIEKDIAEQPITVATLHPAAQRLESLDTGEIVQALVEMLVRCLPADAATVYLLEQGRLVAAAHLPMEEAAPDPAIVVDDAVVRRVLSTGNASNIHESFSASEQAVEQSGARHILMAAPLLGPDQAILGIVTVEKMAFLSFNPASIAAFEVVSRWASRRLSQAAGWLTSNVTVDSSTAVSVPATLRRIWQEIDRARRYQQPLSLVVLHVDSSGGSPGRVADQIRGSLRDVDELGQHQRPGCFVCVLPETSAAQAHSVGRRLSRLIGGGRRPEPVTYGVATLSGRNGSATSLLDEADAAASPDEGENPLNHLPRR